MKNATSIVVPCFNEEARIPIKYWRELINKSIDINWLFIDDGSNDRTFEILERICAGSSAKTLKLPKNVGKGNAIRQGFLRILEENPEIELIGYLDSDGAFSLQDIFGLVNKASKADSFLDNSIPDAVISSRVSLSGRFIDRRRSRHYLGRIIATYLTQKWNDAPYDTQCGFKLFKNSQSFQNSIKNSFSTKWFVDIELLTRIGISNKGKLVIWEEPLNFWRDVNGSKLGFTSYPRIFVEIVVARKQVLKFIKERKSLNGLN
jgi:glycosyltransferase involved in cell wall biosynthesis